MLIKERELLSLPSFEINVLVAENIMGFAREKKTLHTLSGTAFVEEVWFDSYSGDFWEKPHDYSTSISSAWDIVTKKFFPGIGDDWNFQLLSDQGEIACWGAKFTNLESKKEYSCWTSDAPLAICCAALKAVGVVK